jgi:hypothetical protein
MIDSIDRPDLAESLGVVKAKTADLGNGMVGLLVRHRYVNKPGILGMFSVRAKSEAECVEMVREALPARMDKRYAR